MKVSLVIPMYNESSIIKDTALTLDAYMKDRFDEYEILFSNDGSRDDCADIVRGLALPNVTVTGYEKNRGKGCAVRTAVLQATGDVVVFTDADLAYGCEVIGRAADIFAAEPEVDMVIGSRNISADGYEGYTFVRKLVSKTYIKVLCLLGGFRLSDSQCGCKAFRRSAAEQIFSLCEIDGFSFDFEVILLATRMKLVIREMPVKIINHRESKVHVLSDSIKMVRDIMKIKKQVKRKLRS